MRESAYNSNGSGSAAVIWLGLFCGVVEVAMIKLRFKVTNSSIYSLIIRSHFLIMLLSPNDTFTRRIDERGMWWELRVLDHFKALCLAPVFVSGQDVALSHTLFPVPTCVLLLIKSWIFIIVLGEQLYLFMRSFHEKSTFCCSSIFALFDSSSIHWHVPLLHQRRILKRRWSARTHSPIKKPITDAGVRNMIAEWWIHWGNKLCLDTMNSFFFQPVLQKLQWTAPYKEGLICWVLDCNRCFKNYKWLLYMVSSSCFAASWLHLFPYFEIILTMTMSAIGSKCCIAGSSSTLSIMLKGFKDVDYILVLYRSLML